MLAKVLHYSGYTMKIKRPTWIYLSALVWIIVGIVTVSVFVIKTNPAITLQILAYVHGGIAIYNLFLLAYWFKYRNSVSLNKNMLSFDGKFIWRINLNISDIDCILEKKREVGGVYKLINIPTFIIKCKNGSSYECLPLDYSNGKVYDKYKSIFSSTGLLAVTNEILNRSAKP